MTLYEIVTTVLFAFAVPIIMIVWGLGSALYGWLANNINSLFVRGENENNG